MAVLVVFSGLPGVGKSTLARRVAEELGAVYLRADTIEQALRDCGFGDDQIGGAGYTATCRVATENLRLKRHVVADQVNPWPLTRDLFHQSAEEAGAAYLDVEVVCSDPVEHRRRVVEREIDVPGLVRPSWDDVMERDYRPWDTPVLQVDTSAMDLEACLQSILVAVPR